MSRTRVKAVLHAAAKSRVTRVAKTQLLHFVPASMVCQVQLQIWFLYCQSKFFEFAVKKF